METCPSFNKSRLQEQAAAEDNEAFSRGVNAPEWSIFAQWPFSLKLHKIHRGAFCTGRAVQHQEPLERAPGPSAPPRCLPGLWGEPRKARKEGQSCGCPGTASLLEDAAAQSWLLPEASLTPECQPCVPCRASAPSICSLGAGSCHSERPAAASHMFCFYINLLPMEKQKEGFAPT